MLDLTDAAIQEFKSQVSKSGREGFGIRISAADGGGCGQSYGMEVVAKGEPGDSLIEKDGLKIFVDPMAHITLFDSTIDCVGSGDAKNFSISGPSSSCC